MHLLFKSKIIDSIYLIKFNCKLTITEAIKNWPFDTVTLCLCPEYVIQNKMRSNLKEDKSNNIYWFGPIQNYNMSQLYLVDDAELFNIIINKNIDIELIKKVNKDKFETSNLY